MSSYSPTEVPCPFLSPDFLKPPQSSRSAGHCVDIAPGKQDQHSRPCSVPQINPARVWLVYSGACSPAGLRTTPNPAKASQAQPPLLRLRSAIFPSLYSANPSLVPGLHKQVTYFILKIMHRKMFGMTRTKLLPRKHAWDLAFYLEVSLSTLLSNLCDLSKYVLSHRITETKLKAPQ